MPQSMLVPAQHDYHSAIREAWTSRVCAARKEFLVSFSIMRASCAQARVAYALPSSSVLGNVIVYMGCAFCAHRRHAMHAAVPVLKYLKVQ